MGCVIEIGPEALSCVRGGDIPYLVGNGVGMCVAGGASLLGKRYPRAAIFVGTVGAGLSNLAAYSIASACGL